ncbi:MULTISPECIES: phosphatase PAP2 family protein [unclassified Gordonia (in: high G+C Gram-positive bacteria)]|uniref:phosphatase PAP2 family protein n=1 Tax=unclassified Gordonia (in: high G+C Gram-positive bacteria) TaxID=2657482 RepID=UPI001F0D7812|nr:phosphatase PAP2 family protein [Gordonia sp. ABSL49_1]MCH5644754.1 phosphatase PAP2 family protein [Gordonia sp. ABSL49_1]
MKHVPYATAAALLAVIALFGLALGTGHNPLGQIDESALRTMVAHRHAALDSVVVTTTALFGPVWIAAMTFATAGVAYVVDRSVQRPLIVLCTVGAAGAVCELLKLAVARARPPAVLQISTVETTGSYPSGHVAGTAALLLVIAVLTTRSRRARALTITAALVVTALVAATRLYMAVHWLTDVGAAVALGAAAVLVVPPLVRAGVADTTERARVTPPRTEADAVRHRHRASAPHEIR